MMIMILRIDVRKMIAFFGLLIAALIFMFMFAGIWTEHQVKKIYKARESKRSLHLNKGYVTQMPMIKGKKNVTEWDV
jgi:hypothetical protein